ncbi:MAG: beta-ketoacyl-ACP synthase II [Candidatus Omnitrophica bacterium]|nr:beta-ketoacyl-ACP synthase II [Candidatus Omnitrophota bacterium]MCF7894522.1 beta-ketoacyl-ACP synthase II [Candidatus Omnitrophota bacterium]
MNKVVVTSCGVVSPVGIGKVDFWDALTKGRSGVGPITQFDSEQFDSKIAGEVNDFDPTTFLLPKEQRRIPRFVQFSLQAAQEAIDQAGIDFEKINPYQVGTIIGSGIGSLETVEKEYKVLLEKGPRRLSPFMIPRLITNEAAGYVAIRFGLKGPNLCTVTACASGAHAIGEAYRVIKEGKAKVMVCGGTEACIVPLAVGGFCALKALSRRNDDPTKASRPFDKDRDGFIMAEGAGIVILEEMEHAKKRGAKIYGELSGYGSTCDAYHITAPNPNGESAAEAMKSALAEASFDKHKPIHLNTHGTSTLLNDKMETKAIKLVFGQKPENLAINSIKSMLGHTLGAAGAIEFISCCLTLEKSVIPPTINYEYSDPECDLDYTPNQARKLEVDACLSNSLGFGGHNASLLVEKI